MREREGREASPTAAIIDSQAPRPLKKGFFDRSARLQRGQEGHGPQAAHPRRHARPLLNVVIHPADIQDRDGAGCPLSAHAPPLPLHRTHLRRCRYQGPSWRQPRHDRHLADEIVKRNELHRFIVLPKRWIVERTFAWISRNRRLPATSSVTHDRRRLRPSRHDPPHASALDQANPLLMNPYFLDRL